MSILCFICKETFEIPLNAQDREILVSCPACGFIGHWSSQTFSIPTHQEESTLEQIEGASAVSLNESDTGDATVVAQSISDLPLPHKRILIFTIQNGNRAGDVLKPQMGRVVIGRQDADIALDDSKISRKHAIIEAISRENIFVRDLASTNGTFLNGIEVRSKKLCSNDIIRVGDTEIQFVWEDLD